MISRDLAAPFLEGARAATLRVQRCAGCGQGFLPPVMTCDRCGGRDLRWVQASGRGRVASFAVIHRAPSEEHARRVPYIYAAIELAEGAVLVSNVVDVDPGALAVGDEVQVVFERVDAAGQPWPEFRPLRRPS